MQAVGVLGRVDELEHAVGVQARRERQLDEEPGAGGVRTWFTPGLAAVLAASAAATVVLSGTDVGVVAVLRSHDAVTFTGVVFAAWSLGSMTGAAVYGALRRPISPLVLLGGLAVLTIPVGLAPSPWLLAAAILPANGRRVVRALEVIELTGRPFSATMPRPGPARWDTVQLGLDLDTATLDERVDRRVERMFAAGLVEEVRELAGRGLRADDRKRLAARA